MATKAQMKVLDELQGKLAKKFGANSIMRAAEMPPTKVVPSGSLSLDIAMGVGGIPTNRVIEVIGAEGGGKTTLSLLIMKQLLEKDPTRHAAFFDFEHKLTSEWVEKLVGEEIMDRMLYFSPDHAEQGINMYVEAVKTGTIQHVIWDSIASAPTQRVMKEDADAGTKDVGGNAGAITQLARIAATFSSKYDSLFLGTNQLRDTIGSRVPTAATANSPGGHAWRHACIARIELKPNGDKFSIKENGEELQVGYGIKARIFKNQLAAPFRTANWNFFNIPSEKYGPVGIDTTEECLRLARTVGVVDVTTGGMFHHAALPGGKIRGEDNFKNLVSGDPALRATIVSEVMARVADDSSLAGTISPIEIDEENELTQEAFADALEEPDMLGNGVVGGKLNLGAKRGN